MTAGLSRKLQAPSSRETLNPETPTSMRGESLMLGHSLELGCWNLELPAVVGGHYHAPDESARDRRGRFHRLPCRAPPRRVEALRSTRRGQPERLLRRRAETRAHRPDGGTGGISLP